MFAAPSDERHVNGHREYANVIGDRPLKLPR
ncbi:hypothetical protein P3T43_005841 [Paraburkholderia sp. GAS41]|jgi:hypothetical protein